MSYTSNQYKYLLIKRLQRHFSMKSPRDRAYTQTFFWELFDDTVTVTEASYNNFCRLMDDEIALCAENDWYNSTSIPPSVINEQGLLLTKAFAEIGIELKITTNSLGGKAEFTKPDGTVMTYINSDFYINGRGRSINMPRCRRPPTICRGWTCRRIWGTRRSQGRGRIGATTRTRKP